MHEPEQTYPLPPRFAQWFATQGWSLRPHQAELIRKAEAGRSTLLIAPTGAGKTLAGFLPSLLELADGGSGALHTLYLSPLKALAVDIQRNLERPVAGMGLPLRIETRTGDTPASRRQRQRVNPPDILLTTPEQLSLLLASPDAARYFSSLRRIVLDELHALVTSKRGDLLSLALARLAVIAPQVQRVGLSATVANPDDLRRYLVPQSGPQVMADLVQAPGAVKPIVTMLETAERIPWAGHSARHAFGDIYRLIAQHRLTLLFVNTRAQAEMVFQSLWTINEDGLPIALHHGSLDVSQRRRVEEAMAAGKIRAVVATSSLDMGIDWGDVDLVVNVGAPKGASRLTQRIGRANHRLDEPSRAVLVPANRFEVLECRAGIEAVARGAQDTPPLRQGALDVLAQHILGVACGTPFLPDELYAEVCLAAPYRHLSRKDFDDAVDCVATGGYALRGYERFARIRATKDGRYRVSHPRVAQQYRMNIGTIVEEAMLRVRLVRSRAVAGGPTGLLGRGGRVLGEVEEYFIEGLVPGDTFAFAGEVLAYLGMVENEVLVSRSAAREPKIPAYAGGKFPLSTYLADAVREMLADPRQWKELPFQVREWLTLQDEVSALPGRSEMLVETFPRGEKHYLVAYPFEGRLAHQTLGMLLTRRLERAGLQPLGFVASDYAIAIWGLADLGHAIAAGKLSLADLFAEDMLGDDLEEWLNESQMMKRTFRQCAIISGMIERRFPGREKTGRQMTISTDLVYDVLRRHQPDHVLLRAAYADASTGLLDIARLGDMLARIRGAIVHRRLTRISPLAVPIMLEIGREPIYGEAGDRILAEAETRMLDEVTRAT